MKKITLTIMGTKEFSKELGDLMDRVAREGIAKGHITFAQVIGTIEMCKMDMGRYAEKVALHQQAQQAPRILVPKPPTLDGQ